MQTISINFIVPGSWEEMSDKQLRYVYQLLADNFGTDEIKTLFLLKWSGTKVIGRQESGSYLVKLGKNLFCLLYTSDAADDMQCVYLGGRRIIKKIFF